MQLKPVSCFGIVLMGLAREPTGPNSATQATPLAVGKHDLSVPVFCAESGVSRVVYVSCNPDTLARDCAIFRDCGYEIGTAIPVDLFPRTGHVETVVLMTRTE